MKQDVFAKIAAEEGISREEVIAKVEEAIETVYSSTDPHIVMIRGAIFGSEKPTPEAFVHIAARYVSPPK